MSTKTHILAFNAPASTIVLGQGKYFFIAQAASAVDIELRRRDSSVEQLSAVAAGLKYKPLDPDASKFYEIAITSSVIQQVTLVISDSAEVDYASVVSVTGSVLTSAAPSSTIATPADAAIAGAGIANIAANALRKRIWIGSLSSNAGTVNLRVHVSGAGAAKGFEIQAGQYEKFETSAALTIFNGDAGAQSYWVFEES
jgi:hypothetical protein